MTKSEIDALIERLCVAVREYDEAVARPPSHDSINDELMADVAMGHGHVFSEATAALREQQEEIERLTHLINIDWDCLPTCNSFGHDPECPYCNGEPKLRLLVERVADLEADREMLREVGQKDYDGMRDMQAKYIRADHARIAAEAERDALRADAERWNAFVELWHASADLHATQDEDGRWSLTQFEAAKAEWTPGCWTGDTPDDAIAPIVAALAQEMT